MGRIVDENYMPIYNDAIIEDTGEIGEWIVKAETLEELENGFYTISNNGEPLVRCKYCLYYEPNNSIKCQNPFGGMFDCKPDSYCSDGFIKEEYNKNEHDC